MRRFIGALLLCLLALGIPAAALEPPELGCKAAILVEKTTGQVLFELNADEPRPQASITKIMTAILAIESCDPDSVVTVSETACRGMLERGGDCYLIPGEQIPFDIMLRYVLLISGNEGANALAEHVSGSLAEFVKLMNTKAAALGLENTRFGNAHGLHTMNHYSSARDIAALAQYAMENETFRQVVSETQVTMPKTEQHPQAATMYTYNYMLGSRDTARYLYPGNIGVKTGYSGVASGLCFAGAFEADGLEFYTVVLGAENEADGAMGSFADTARLMDYARQFELRALVSAGEAVAQAAVSRGQGGGSVALTADREVLALLPEDADPGAVTLGLEAVPLALTAPVDSGQAVATVDVLYGGQVYGRVTLYPDRDVALSLMLRPWLWVAAGAVTVLIVGAVLWRGRKKRKS